MQEPYYRTPLAADGTYEQWSLVQKGDGEYVRHDRVTPVAHFSGAPIEHMLSIVPIGEFLTGDHHPLAKTRLQNLLDKR
jgi:hypothetical protein